MSSYEIDQYMKPHGEEGKEVIDEMNMEHTPIFDFAVEHVKINKTAKILDIGCGGGINVERFLKLTENNVDGLDYSEISVSESIKRNQDAIDDNRCNIMQASVTDMPIEDNTYDIATAFSTVFFWPDIIDSFKNVLRIIKTDGQFVIANGTDGSDSQDDEPDASSANIKIYTPDELEAFLVDAGFKNIEVFHNKDTHHVVIISQK